jgi:hypothetical protein
MTFECELGARGVITGKAVPKRGRQERARAGFPVLTTATGICSRYAIKSLRGLLGAERIPDHMGRRGRRHAGWGSGLCRSALPDGERQDQFAYLNRSENLPGEACPAWPNRRSQRDAATWPAPATKCTGAGQASPASPCCGLRRAVRPWLCPRPASMEARSFFLGCENLSGGEGIPRVRHSETRDRDARASRLGPNVVPARCSLLTRLVPVLRQANGQYEHRRVRARIGGGPNHGKRFHIIAD